MNVEEQCIGDDGIRGASRKKISELHRLIKTPRLCLSLIALIPS